MDPNHRRWNANQHRLQEALSHPATHPEWLELFLDQHARLHSGKLSDGTGWSFEDEALHGLDDSALRAIPPTVGHSLAWILWHLARCEDLTMNILVGGVEQVLTRQSWMQPLRSSISHTGNAIDSDEIAHFSQSIDVDRLKAYRLAVGQSTREVVSCLTPADLGRMVEPARMERVRGLGVVLDPGILKYWSSRKIAGLLLMPPTRHCFTHLNEALRIRRALQKVSVR